MEEQFATLGMIVHRLEATTPATIDDSDLTPLSITSAREKLSDIELAISISHFRAWRHMLAEGCPWVLVLEDDVRLSALLPRFLAEFEHGNFDVGVLRLETHMERVLLYRRGEQAPLGISMHIPVRYGTGAGAYVISASYARNILTSPRRFVLPVDDILFSSRSPFLDRTRVRNAVPGLAIFQWEFSPELGIPHSVLVSDGQLGRTVRWGKHNKTKQPVAQKIPREIRRLSTQIPNGHKNFWYWLMSRKMIVPFADGDVSGPPSAAPPHG